MPTDETYCNVCRYKQRSFTSCSRSVRKMMRSKLESKTPNDRIRCPSCHYLRRKKTFNGIRPQEMSKKELKKRRKQKEKAKQQKRKPITEKKKSNKKSERKKEEKNEENSSTPSTSSASGFLKQFVN